MSRGRLRLNNQPKKEQRGDVKRAGVSARTSEHDRASATTRAGGSPPASHASHSFAVLALAPRPAHLWIYAREVILRIFLMNVIQENFYLCCVPNNLKSLFV